MRIYSIYDRKMMEFGPLFYGPNDETMVRSLKEAFPTMTGTIKEYPEDFELKYLGEFEPESGLIVPADSPKLIAIVESLVPPGEV